LILVDSSVWIDYFNGKPTWQADTLDQKLSDELIAIGDLILIEVLQGFRTDRDYYSAKAILNTLDFHQMGGYEIAIQSTQMYRELRKKGVTVRKTIDVIIAAYCVSKNLTLLHNDRDFDPILIHFPLKTILPS
jgi:predicted nucleic acid-binding protein